MIVIGLTGRCRSGKTTVSDAIDYVAGRRYGLKVKQYEFGQVVLDYCITSGRLPKKTRDSVTPPELHTLVYVGSQMRRKDPDFWVDMIASKIMADNPEIAILCGLRFPNEVSLVKGSGGYLVRVISLNADGSEFISPDRDPNDPTETSLLTLPTDYVLTAYRGQMDLLAEYSHSIFNDLKRKTNA